MVVTWSLLAVVCLLGLALAAMERSKARRFDPNSEDREARIQKGRNRATTRAEFEATQRQQAGAEDR